jgi:AraC family transcriptional regulator
MTQSTKSSALEYQKRLNRALSYIRENLDKPLSLGDVAKAACFSEFHFHRVFSSLMHETLGEYITRKKLEHAAIKLAYLPAPHVTAIADEVGYASVSSFSKAFNQWFGCRPTDIQQIKQRLDLGGGKLQTKYEKSIEANQLFVSDKENDEHFAALNARVKVRVEPATTVVYVTSPKGYDVDSIRRTWTQLFQLIEDAGIDWNSCERFSVSHDHPGLTPAERCRYDACVSVPKDNITKLDLPTALIPAGRYAVYPVEGPEASILDQYLEFYTVWMPQSGYEPENFPVVEHYLQSCENGNLKVELWAKVKRLRAVTA